MTNTYFTPPAVVEAVKKEAVETVYEMRNNSGAFLAEALKAN